MCPRRRSSTEQGRHEPSHRLARCGHHDKSSRVGTWQVGHTDWLMDMWHWVIVLLICHCHTIWFIEITIIIMVWKWCPTTINNVLPLWLIKWLKYGLPWLWIAIIYQPWCVPIKLHVLAWLEIHALERQNSLHSQAKNGDFQKRHPCCEKTKKGMDVKHQLVVHGRYFTPDDHEMNTIFHVVIQAPFWRCEDAQYAQ